MKVEQGVKIFNSFTEREGTFAKNEHFLVKEVIKDPVKLKVSTAYSIYVNNKKTECIGIISNLETAISIAKLLNKDCKDDSFPMSGDWKPDPSIEVAESILEEFIKYYYRLGAKRTHQEWSLMLSRAQGYADRRNAHYAKIKENGGQDAKAN